MLIYPFKRGTQFLLYDRVAHIVTFEDDPALAHPASYANSARLTTSMRYGVEQFHGAVAGTYKVCSIIYHFYYDH